MSEGKQSRLSPGQKADVWSRWKAGESLREMGRAYGKPHNCIRCVLLPSGGISPTARRRSGVALSLAEREDISRGIASGIIDAHDSQRPRSGGVDSEPGGHAPWRRCSLSRPRCGSASLEIRFATEEVSSCQQPQVAEHGRE